jgi:hypothetical protein
LIEIAADDIKDGVRGINIDKRDNFKIDRIGNDNSIIFFKIMLGVFNSDNIVIINNFEIIKRLW